MSGIYKQILKKMNYQEYKYNRSKKDDMLVALSNIMSGMLFVVLFLLIFIILDNNKEFFSVGLIMFYSLNICVFYNLFLKKYLIINFILKWKIKDYVYGKKINFKDFSNYLLEKGDFINDLFPSNNLTDGNKIKFYEMFIGNVSNKRKNTEFIKYITNSYNSELRLSNSKIESLYNDGNTIPNLMKNFKKKLDIFNDIKQKHSQTFNLINNKNIMYSQINNDLNNCDLSNINNLKSIYNQIEKFLNSIELKAVKEYEYLMKLDSFVNDKMTVYDKQMVDDTKILFSSFNSGILGEINKCVSHLNEKYN